MTKINFLKHISILGSLLLNICCVTPHRELNPISKVNCDPINGDSVTLVFQDTNSNRWSDWEKSELSNFIKEYTCTDFENGKNPNLELILRKTDVSPPLSTFGAATQFINLLTLFFIPSNRELAKRLQLEVRDLRGGHVKVFETELRYSKFSHILAATTLPFRDDEFDFDKKLIFELISKARSEKFNF